MERIKITELDHIVLNVGDIHRSLKFYIEVLGLQPERLDEFKAGKVGFPSVRINGDTIIDLFPTRGAGNLNKQEKREREISITFAW
jgi:catechol 2,3-dioxygenase-like lactoylglutathione lyase family enzyme